MSERWWHVDSHTRNPVAVEVVRHTDTDVVLLTHRGREWSCPRIGKDLANFPTKAEADRWVQRLPPRSIKEKELPPISFPLRLMEPRRDIRFVWPLGASSTALLELNTVEIDTEDVEMLEQLLAIAMSSLRRIAKANEGHTTHPRPDAAG